MKRLLFFSIPISIMACSIIPIVDSVNRQDGTRLVDGDPRKAQLISSSLPENKPLYFERQRPKKVAAYSINGIPCSNIKTENLKKEILAKLDCMIVELER